MAEQQSPCLAHPESIAELRLYVEDWLKKARKSVKSFHNDKNNTFWRDSLEFRDPPKGKDKNKFNATTTARCYMALAYADRGLRKSGDLNDPDWADWFESFLSSTPFSLDGNEVKSRGEKSPLNNFDVSHLADFAFVSNYLNRFFGKSLSFNSPDSDQLSDRLLSAFTDNAFAVGKTNGESEPLNKSGQIAFEQDGSKWFGHHFFVTLHSLRALSILHGELELRERHRGDAEQLITPIRQYCIEQCFYVSKGIRHRQDIVGLAFSGTALYSDNSFSHRRQLDFPVGRG